MQSSGFTFVEVFVGNEEPAVETEIWWVADTVLLQFPINIEAELLAAIVDAICRC